MALHLTDRKWNWIDDGALPYALDAMRAIWVWLIFHLWAHGLTPTRGDWLAPFTVFGLLAVSTLFAQYGAFRARTGVRATLLVAFGGLGAVMLALYLAVGLGRFAPWDVRWFGALADDPLITAVVLIVAVWLWRWGIVTGREPLIYDAFAFHFAFGILVFVAALGIAYAAAIVPPVELLFPLLLFFAISLGALAVSSLQSARRFEQQQTGQWFALNRYWLGIVGAVIGALLVGGLFLSQFFAPEAVAGILSGLTVLLDLLARLLYWVVLVAAFVVFALFGLIARVFPTAGLSVNPPAIATPPNLADQFKDLQQQPAGLSPEAYLALQVIAGTLIAAFIILIFALAFRRFKVLLEEDVEETRETIFSFDLLKEQLAQLFKRKSQGQGASAPPFAAIRGDDARAQIRRTYQALLAFAAAHGIPRSPGQTPNEYLTSLARGMHIYLEPMMLITEAYVQARYSLTPISPDRADEVLRAWQVIASDAARGNGRGKL
jgi:hypothetical protein